MRNVLLATLLCCISGCGAAIPYSPAINAMLAELAKAAAKAGVSVEDYPVECDLEYYADESMIGMLCFAHLPDD